MPRYRFQWANLSPDLIHELATGLKLDGDAMEALKERYGSRPKPEFIHDSWQILLEKWLLNDPIAANQIAAALKTRDLGDVEIEDSITYLKTCRNTSGFRDIVIDAFIAKGEEEEKGTQGSSEINVRNQIQRLTGAQLLGKVAELCDASKSELVRASGYSNVNDDGTEILYFTNFYQALLEAQENSSEKGEPLKTMSEWITANKDDDGKILWSVVPEKLISSVDDIDSLASTLSEKDQVFMFDSLSPGLRFAYNIVNRLLDEEEDIITELEQLSDKELPIALSMVLQNCDAETNEAVNAMYKDKDMENSQTTMETMVKTNPVGEWIENCRQVNSSWACMIPSNIILYRLELDSIFSSDEGWYSEWYKEFNSDPLCQERCHPC